MSASSHDLLLVDDNPLHLDAIATRLERSGFSVLTETNALDAVRAVETMRPSIVISDIRMPKMDGFMLCREIRQNELISHTPIILYSAGDIDAHWVRRARAMKAETLTLATLNVETLVERIRLLQGAIAAK